MQEEKEMRYRVSSQFHPPKLISYFTVFKKRCLIESIEGVETFCVD